MEVSVQRLKQVLLEAFHQPVDCRNWPEWKERFHAATMHLLHAAESADHDKEYLSGCIIAPSGQQLDHVPELLRTKMDESSEPSSTFDSTKLISERAKSLLLSIDQHPRIPHSGEHGEPVIVHEDHHLIRKLYFGE